MDTLAGMSMFVFLFLAILAILWFCLPFAVFGVKERLSTLIREQKTTNDLLRKLVPPDRS